MPRQDDNNEKDISRRGQGGQSEQGSQDTTQNKSNVNTETHGGNRPEPRSKASEQNEEGEHRHATDEEMAADKEMD